MVRYILYMLITYPGRFLSDIGWWKWRVEGIENIPPRSMGGMIIATNHVHWVDIVAIGALVPYTHILSWFGKIELFESAFGNWFFTTMNVVPVKRGKGDMSALNTAKTMLQNGAVFAFFPEGHRNINATLQRGQSGAIRLALKSGVPIVPGAITGSQHGLKGGPLRKELTLRLGTPYILEPVPDGKVPPRVMKELVKDLMLRIAMLLPEENRGYYADEIKSD